MGSFTRFRPQAVGAFGLAGVDLGTLNRADGLHHLMTLTLMNVSPETLVIVSHSLLGASVWCHDEVAGAGTPLACQHSLGFALASTDPQSPTEARLVLAGASGQPILIHVSGGGRLASPVATCATGLSGRACSIQVNSGARGSDVTLSLS